VTLLLGSAALSFGQGQPASAGLTIDQLAQKVAPHLQAEHVKVVVMDFHAPDGRLIPFGAYLADELSAALSKQSGSFTVIDRNLLASTPASNSVNAESEFDFEKLRSIANAAGADWVVTGSYGEFKGALGISVNLFPAKGATDSRAGLRVDSTEGKLIFTPEMAAQLAQPLETLRPRDSVTRSGTAGLTNVKCLECRQAQYTRDALKARIQGTVFLTVVVTPEGRAGEVKLVRGLGGGLDESAIHAVSGWKFSPALDPDGKPTSAMQTVMIRFKIGI